MYIYIINVIVPLSINVVVRIFLPVHSSLVCEILRKYLVIAVLINFGIGAKLCLCVQRPTATSNDPTTMVRLHPKVLEQRQQANLSDIPGMFNASLMDVKQQPPKRMEAGEKTVFEDDVEKRRGLGKYMNLLLRHA